MLKNFLKVTVHGLFRGQVYSLINVSGLVMGLSCSIFIFLWVMDELRYDHFHKDHKRIFEVMENYTNADDAEIYTYEACPAPLTEKLKADFQEVEQACHTSWMQRLLFTNGSQSIYHEGVYADAAFFKLFSFPLLEGDPDHLLTDINSVVISKKMAEKYFPQQSALGKILKVDNDWQLKITGVVKDIPDNSTIEFDFVLPFDLYSKRSSRPLDWGLHSVSTYVKLRDGVDGEAFGSRIKNLLHDTHAESKTVNLFLFPLNDWRLYWHFENGVQTGGRIFYVVIFSFAAFFILIAACINFMNLATARAVRRAKEVGIRKVAGASRQVLIQQFLAESFFLSFVSLFIALVLTHLLTPLFNQLSNKNLSMDYSDPLLVGGLLGIVLFTGLLAGSYPAFFLSSFKPASVLKGNLFSALKGAGIRKTLVLFQFGLSVVLIICGYVINDQVQYILQKNLGYDKESVIYFSPRPGSLRNMESFKNEMLQNPLIEFVGQGDHPMNIHNNDFAQWDGLPGDKTVTVQTAVCDADYLKAIGLKLLKGRHFSHDLASDSAGYIINETCARLMGFEDPVGKRLKVYKSEGHVIGVVKDFNHRDFHSSIEPVIFVLEQPGPKPMDVYVHYKQGRAREAVEYVEKIYKKFEPLFPLELEFLDKDFAAMYRKEILAGKLSVCFMVITIFISCLGLFGLTLFMIERKTKEIGVRKVLGASVPNLTFMLCKEFSRPVILSLAIGFPVAYYLTGEFLSQYQFHTELSVWAFLFTGIFVMVIAALTVVYQSVKAALANPAETLRTE